MRLATLWEIVAPLPNGVLFTHLRDADGTPVAQIDLLSVPGESWQPGDWFIQLHEIELPQETAVGTYNISTGWYTRQPDGKASPRLPIQNGQNQADILFLTTLSVQ